MDRIAFTPTPPRTVPMPPTRGALLSRHRCFASRSIMEISRHTSGVFSHQTARIELENRGAEVNFVHNQVRFDQVSLNFMDYDCPGSAVWVEAPPVNQCYLFQLSCAGHAELHHNGAISSTPCGSLMVLHPDQPINLRLNADYQTIVMRIDRRLLESLLAEKLGRRLSTPLAFEQAGIALQSGSRAVADMLLSLCHIIDSDFPTLTHSAMARSIQDMLCTLVLTALPHNYSTELQRGLGPAPYYVRRVETYIELHAREAIGFSDLVEAARVSSRTIHDGFRRFRNTTPMAYLKDHRLNLARAALENGPGETVTGIAMDCGFNHLSKFSLEYQQRFGERPSDTLGRREQLRKIAAE